MLEAIAVLSLFLACTVVYDHVLANLLAPPDDSSDDYKL